MEVLEALHRCCSGRLLYSGGEEPESQQLRHYIHLPLTSAEVELHIVNPVGMDYDEAVAACGDREGTGVVNSMA